MAKAATFILNYYHATPSGFYEYIGRLTDFYNHATPSGFNKYIRRLTGFYNHFIPSGLERNTNTGVYQPRRDALIIKIQIMSLAQPRRGAMIIEIKIVGLI